MNPNTLTRLVQALVPRSALAAFVTPALALGGSNAAQATPDALALRSGPSVRPARARSAR